MNKMYICVLDEFPDHMTPTLVAHAVLRHHLAYCVSTILNKEIINLYFDWLETSFRKVVVKVGQKEFDKIRGLDGVIESWENNTLGGKVSCLTVVVGVDIPKVLRFAKLWKPVEVSNE